MAPRILLLPLVAVHLALFVSQTRLPGGEPSAPVVANAPLVEEAAQVSSPVAAPSVEDARQAFARAEALRETGEREAAVAVLQPHLEHPDPELAFEAGFRQAVLRLELGYPKEAAGAAETLLTRFPNGAQRDRTTFLLGLARRQAGDCPGAIDAFFRYSGQAGLLTPYANLQLARCYQQLGDVGSAMTRTEESLQAGGPRLLRVETLEIQAKALEQGGDLGGALGRWERLVDLARAVSYRAEVRLEAARLNRELGRTGAAVAHYVAIVNESPTAGVAVTALDQLGALDAQDQVSYFQAGLVRYWSRNYPAAIRNFDGAMATPSEAANAPAAMYHKAASRLRQGDEDEAVALLLALPGAYPWSKYAPDALLRAGKVLESNAAFATAADAYRRVARDYPASKEGQEGLFRLGLAHLLRSAPGEAAAAWGELEASDAPSDLKALGLLWRGKVEAAGGRSDAARTQWQAAVDLAPTWYGGVRARGLLEGNVGARVESERLDLARVGLSSSELAELGAWTAGRGAPLEVVMAELDADPGLARADELLALGLKAEAGWEVDELAIRLADDPARLTGLAVALQRRGLHYSALLQAQLALGAAGVGARAAPVALQKLLYPLPYAEVFATRGEQYGANPLAFAALVRQESHFDPRALSSADARGLTQVIPPTGREIANALGRSDYRVEDLFRPAVSLEFGAFYFGQRLKRFGGTLFPALAAYNAGDGAVDRWLRDYGADMDVFAERIPYSETNHYVKVVFENYGMYRALYGQQ